MDLTTQTGLLGRINAYLDSGSDPMAPSVMVQTIGHYVERRTIRSGTRHRCSSRCLWSSERATECAAPATSSLTISPAIRLIIVRGDDGVLRGFHNSCGHRGAAVVDDEAGCSPAFHLPVPRVELRQPGHAGLDPQRRRASTASTAPPRPRRASRRGTPRTGVGPTDRPGRTRPMEVAEFLGDLDAELAAFGMADYYHDRTDVFERVVQLETGGRRVPRDVPPSLLARNTIGPYINSNFALFDAFGPHGRMIGLRDSFEAMRTLPGRDQELLPHVAIIYQIFPNTVLVWQGDHFEAWSSHCRRLAIVGCGTSKFARCHRPAGPEYEARWDKNWQILMDTVLLEDFVVARTIHRTTSPVYDQRRLRSTGSSPPALPHPTRSPHQQLAPITPRTTATETAAEKRPA